MDVSLEKYLETIDKSLKPLPVSERVDIVKEIKSSIMEMQQDNLTAEAILDRLGDPREMAKEYLGDIISRNNGLNWNKYLTIIAFYSLAGLGGMCIIPTLAILAPTFILSGIICPIAGGIKLLGYLLGFDVPFVIFEIGSVTFHPIISFIFSILLGAAFYAAGRGSWKLLIKYIQGMSRKKKELSV